MYYQDQTTNAWATIARSPSAQGNIGQKEAVELLVKRGHSLKGVNLQQAFLVEAKIPGAQMWQTKLEGANLELADLHDANLTNAKLYGANLINADLRGAVLNAASINAAHLNGADLSGAYLKGANLAGANLTNADLSGAHLRGHHDMGTGEQREIVITKEQLTQACASPDNPPELPEEFQDFKLKPCPKKE